MLLPAIPIITDETQPHALINEVTGFEGRFEVAASAVTMIEVPNLEEHAE